MTDCNILIGVDVGGTFTDAVVIIQKANSSENFRAKSPSTYPDIGRGVMEAIRLAAGAAGLDLPQLLPRVKRFGLGTTAVTNVVATRSGLRVGLLTTHGFEETLCLARGRTLEVDGWMYSAPSLVDPKAIVGIKERIDRRGKVLKDMNPDDVVAATTHLVEQEGVESLAVSFLWSFLNPVHEQHAAEIVRETYPDLPVTSASQLRPVIREYERTNLAVLNAYSVGAYAGVEKFAEELRLAGLDAPVLLCHSGGGSMSIQQAKEQPVWLSASGPAAGVAAAGRIAANSGDNKALTCDLGGTSYDVAHLEAGEPARTQRGELMGFWTALPRVSVESVGAGGGSLAWIDERGMLRVGPKSAGSSPGPVCYGRGGTQPALTDALLVLGYIDPDRFLGGNMKLDTDATVGACDRLGQALGLDAMETAWGIRAIALAEMVKAARARLSTYALSAAEHSLVSYGGCGALFAAEVAQRVGLRRVLIPELASVLSAYGAATMDIRRDRLSSLIVQLPGDPQKIDAAFEDLRQAVWNDLEADGVPESDRHIVFEADMRFLGQRWELTIPLPTQPKTGDGGAQAAMIFRDEYLRRYGPAATTTSGIIELVSLRAIGIGHMATEGVKENHTTNIPVNAAGAARARAVKVERNKEAPPVQVFGGASLMPGEFIVGPALIDGSDTTIWIPQDMTACLNESRTLIVETNR